MDFKSLLLTSKPTSTQYACIHPALGNIPSLHRWQRRTSLCLSACIHGVKYLDLSLHSVTFALPTHKGYPSRPSASTKLLRVLGGS